MLKKLFRFGLAVSASSIVILPLSVNAQVVPGLTNDGGKLSFYTASLHDAYIRTFAYFYIPKGSNRAITNYPAQGKTHWCRNGRIEKDVRAINRLTEIRPLAKVRDNKVGEFLQAIATEF